MDNNVILSENLNINEGKSMFTAREYEVCELIIKGLTNKEIAEKLIMSEHTVKSHKEKIYSKLNVHNAAQAAIKYYIFKSSLKMQQ